MPQGWRSRKDSANAAHTIKTLYETTNAVPDDLLTAYKRMLRSNKPTVVQAFYDTLVKECPEALKFFVD